MSASSSLFVWVVRSLSTIETTCATRADVSSESTVQMMSLHKAWEQERMRSESLFSSHVQAAAAARLADAKKIPQDKESVELVRFITGYASSLDALMDVTAMSPMLGNKETIDFYAYIQTWVNNNTNSDQAYYDKNTQQCSRIHRTDGNGWSLSVDLAFTPSKQPDHVQPMRVVPVASNAVFSDMELGGFGLHEALLDGNAIVPLPVHQDPDKKRLEDFKKSMATAQNATVFRCDGGAAGLHERLSLFKAARRFVFHDGDDSSIEKELYKSSLEMVSVHPFQRGTGKLPPNHIAVVFNATQAPQLEPGLPLYFEDVVTETNMYGGGTMNASMRFKPMGEVVSVKGSTAVLHFTHGCLPSAANGWEPKLKIPKSKAAIRKAEQFVKEAKAIAETHGSKLRQAQDKENLNKPLETTAGDVLLKGLPVENMIGHIDLQSVHGSKEFRPLLVVPPKGIANGAKVCVITQQSHGRLMDRTFDLPKLQKGDRVVGQFLATGHGWASTEEQCGEFCKMKYDLSFDGAKPAEFMQWRDDCSQNPTGEHQHGTWYAERNGWCPGAVNSGIYVDITDSLNSSLVHHNVALDVSVLSRTTGEYEAYTNLGGWLKHDKAVLTVDLKVFVYPAAAVEAIRNSGKRCSKIHSVLQGASMVPVGARWPQDGTSKRSKLHLFRRSQKGIDTSDFLGPIDDSSGSVEDKAAECAIDFEATSPWYLYDPGSNKVEQNALAHAQETTWSTVFRKRLIQGGSQFHLISVNRTSFPKHWGQVGLRLRLDEPGDGLEIDHWDRIASVGLIVDRPHVQVADTTAKQLWFKTPWWIRLSLIIAVLPVVLLACACAHARGYLSIRSHNQKDQIIG